MSYLAGLFAPTSLQKGDYIISSKRVNLTVGGETFTFDNDITVNIKGKKYNIKHVANNPDLLMGLDQNKLKNELRSIQKYSNHDSGKRGCGNTIDYNDFNYANYLQQQKVAKDGVQFEDSEEGYSILKCLKGLFCLER